MRTHTCGNVSICHVNQPVQLCGWVQSIRILSDTLMFVQLRDAYGTMQVVAEEKRTPGFAEFRKRLQQMNPDTLVQVNGMVAERPPEMQRKAREVELVLSDIRVLNHCLPLPFNPYIKDKLPGEEVRLAHRYLDLRRSDLQYNIRARSRASAIIRQVLDSQGFVDIETPMLFKSTPEGAREFLVPTRMDPPGACYALPQSPQQFKQMLMASGFDRYYQIARCFRDEDLRADRQPEFTQVDLEMSFVSSQDIQSVAEQMIQQVWKQIKGVDIAAPFARMSFAEATNRFGSDKPDTRYGLETRQVPELLRSGSGNNSVVDVLVVSQGARIFSTKELAPFKDLIQNSQNNGESRITTLHKIKDNYVDTGLGQAALLSRWNASDIQTLLKGAVGAKPGDLLFVSERSTFVTPANTTLGRVRTLMAKLLQERGKLHVPKEQYNFLWIEKFPLFTREQDSSQGRLSATHHPFTAPVEEDQPLLYTDPARVHGQHYDLVLNGVELGGGSIRVHDAAMQQHIFKNILGLPSTVQASFEHLVRALAHGCPPHGGIALGLDRLVAMLTNSESLRDVVAFPKSASGRDLFMDLPVPATLHQLREYGLCVRGNQEPLAGKNQE